MNKQYNEELGERIKARRKELKMSLEEVSFKLGYKSKASMYKIEKGESEIPLSKLRMLANVLNVNVLELMGYKI